ncbi:MAG: bifunctional alpha,alpha-trehalose-phosphate synthase (UDP-forming)/trehalose-phosphatase [Spirochaetes bacterium]|nr:bifunctional alpha,alpha-trehalose-phosphate synthase (UDP-forming)/trehalose-phosphatase [Spirochaetota bacterium]
MINKDIIHNFKRIIIIANRLPFNIISKNGKKEIFQNSGGLVSAIMSLSEKLTSEDEKSPQIIWVGNSDHSKAEFDELIETEDSFDLYPVNIPEEINKDFYHGFCNDTIWPLFHYFPMFTIFKESYYKAYKTANNIFFEAIENLIQPDDFIWVHDYQLLLLPELIRKKVPKANIGFFLHIPFPSYEIFRLLNQKWREELLKGILGADLVGFHTNDYTQNFLKTVRRILGYDNTIRTILTPERIIKADSFPISIDYNTFTDALDTGEVKKEIKIIEKHLGKFKLVFSVDRLDYTKGIKNRLIGIAVFLEKYPQWHNKVIFNMVVVPSRDTIPRYQKMKKEIEATVGRINGKYGHLGWRPIVYQYKSLKFEQLIALYSICHVGLITPLRDGLNLVAKEFVACQGKNTGVLILSEFAGAVAELGEAIIINPADTNEMADSIKLALELNENEKIERIERMKKRIRNYDIFAWAEDFMTQLQYIKEEQSMLEIKILNSGIEAKIKENYRKASSRIFFLDYDGTLVPFTKYPEKALPDDRVIKQISHLAADKKNTVVIISGRNREFLDKCFSNPEITIIAEHGYFIKYPHGEWDILAEKNDDHSWKETVIPLLERYTERCNGSFVEEKESSLVWHYRNVEPDFALVRSQELKEELEEFLLHNKDLQMVEGNKIVEINQSGHDKGTAVKEILNGKKFDFIFAAGDDRTDEDIFKALPEEACSIKVGLVQSNAKYNISRQYEINDLIDMLIKE